MCLPVSSLTCPVLARMAHDLGFSVSETSICLCVRLHFHVVANVWVVHASSPSIYILLACFDGRGSRCYEFPGTLKRRAQSSRGRVRGGLWCSCFIHPSIHLCVRLCVGFSSFALFHAQFVRAATAQPPVAGFQLSVKTRTDTLLVVNFLFPCSFVSSTWLCTCADDGSAVVVMVVVPFLSLLTQRCTLYLRSPPALRPRTRSSRVARLESAGRSQTRYLLGNAALSARVREYAEERNPCAFAGAQAVAFVKLGIFGKIPRAVCELLLSLSCALLMRFVAPWSPFLQLARRGYNIMLVARGKEGLKRAAKELAEASRYGNAWPSFSPLSVSNDQPLPCCAELTSITNEPRLYAVLSLTSQVFRVLVL